MKKIIMLVTVMFFLALPAFAETISLADKELNRRGFHIYASDSDVDTTAELISELDSTYAQLAAEDNIEVLSAEAGDTTQTVTVVGIDDSGVRIQEEFSLAGATAQTSTATFRYIDQASVDIECAGVVTIRRATGDTFITSIPVGTLQAQMAQHFNGEKVTYVTGWWASNFTTTGDVTLELRWYPDDADCLDAGDGYIVLDEIFIESSDTSPSASPLHVFPQAIECPAGGWLCVYGTGSVNNSDAKVTLQGFDM